MLKNRVSRSRPISIRNSPPGLPMSIPSITRGSSGGLPAPAPTMPSTAAATSQCDLDRIMPASSPCAAHQPAKGGLHGRAMPSNWSHHAQDPQIAPFVIKITEDPRRMADKGR